MAKYVPDIKTQRWVIISPLRVKRPGDISKPTTATKSVCPFCEGNESFTPPEVYRQGKGERDISGWQVRVVPNKFPITDIHEVIIHNPNHNLDIAHVSSVDAQAILTAYRDRYRHHQDNGQVLIFCNAGLIAGASLAHPHSQLVVIPKQIMLDTLVREPVANRIAQSNGYVAYCPDFSQWPYEVWIAPEKEGTKFSDVENADIPIITDLLQRSLLNIEHTLKKLDVKSVYADGVFEYNYYIYHGESWYLRIIPRLIHRAGFELGTGLSVNIVDPHEAAQHLRQL